MRAREPRSPRRRSRASCRGSTSRRCAWTSSAGGRCWSSSGTSAASTRCARCPTCKAWHERYADDGLRVIGVHTGGFPPSRDDDAGPRRGRAARDRVSGRDRHRPRDLGPLRQRGLARRATCGTANGALFSHALRRGRLRARPSARSRSCSASSASSSRRVRPEDDAGRAAAGPDRRTSRARTRAPTRRAACGRCSTARASCASTAARSRSSEPGCVPARRARPPHRGRARARGRRRASRCHATCFTPGGGRWAAAPRGRGRRAGARAAAAPSSLDQDRGARPVGRARSARAGEEVRLVDPRAGVDAARAPAGVRPLARGRRAATGRSGASGPRSRARASMPSRREHLAHAAQAAAAQRRRRRGRASSGPRPSALSAGHRAA